MTPDEARRLLHAADPAPTSFLTSADDSDLRSIPFSEEVAEDDLAPRRRRRRLSRRHGVALTLAAITAIGGTAAASTFLREPAPEVSGIECITGDNNMMVVGATATSPLDRCREVLAENDLELAPDAVAYRLPGRIPIVGPRSSMPAEATVITNEKPDARLAELNHAITDTYSGIGFEAHRPCQNLDTTRREAEALLTRLNITDYTLETTKVDLWAGDACTTARVDSQTHRIVLERRRSSSFRSDTEQDPEIQHIRDFEREVGQRAAELTRKGGSARQMSQMVRDVAAKHEVDREVYEVHVTESPVAGAPRLYLQVGGKASFHIYAPEGE